jgi:hypothetical protein
MILLDINLDYLFPNEDTHKSSYCYVVKNSKTDDLLRDWFGRDGLCIKISRRPLLPGQSVDRAGWGQVPLAEIGRVQNIFAWHDLAPRVYGLVLVNGKHTGQVVDYDQSDGDPDLEAILRLAERYGISPRKNWDFGPRNWVGRHFVDFSGIRFDNPPQAKSDLAERAHTRRGINIGTAYQGVAELGIRGTRKMPHRLATMGLGKINFQGKTVLDLGCNLGAFSRYASDRGAKRVVSVDKATAQLAAEVANWLGYWNIDFLSLSLPDEIGKISETSGIEQFDIVFAMAVVNHIGGYADWISGFCKPRGTLFFEGHGGVPKGKYIPGLERDFETVTLLGETTDNYTRAVFLCRKETV